MIDEVLLYFKFKFITKHLEVSIQQMASQFLFDAINANV